RGHRRSPGHGRSRRRGGNRHAGQLRRRNARRPEHRRSLAVRDDQRGGDPRAPRGGARPGGLPPVPAGLDRRGVRLDRRRPRDRGLADAPVEPLRRQQGGRRRLRPGLRADHEVPNRSVTDLILHLLERPATLVRYVADRPGHDRRYALDAARLRQSGWQSRRGFEEGLAATVAWYREHRSWWEAIKSGAYREYYADMYGGRLRDSSAVPRP